MPASIAARLEGEPAHRARVWQQAHWAPLFEPLNFAAFDATVQGAALRSDGDVDVSKIWLTG